MMDKYVTKSLAKIICTDLSFSHRIIIPPWLCMLWVQGRTTRIMKRHHRLSLQRIFDVLRISNASTTAREFLADASVTFVPWALDGTPLLAQEDSLDGMNTVREQMLVAVIAVAGGAVETVVAFHGVFVPACQN